MPSETEWTRDLCKRLRAIVVPYVASHRQPAGFPDRIVWSPRWQGWLEMKGPRTRLALNQKLKIRALNAVKPGSAWVVRSRAYDGVVHIETSEGEIVATVAEHDLLETLVRLTEPG